MTMKSILLSILICTTLMAGEKPAEPNAPKDAVPPTEYQKIQAIAQELSTMHGIACVYDGSMKIGIGKQVVDLDKAQKTLLKAAYDAKLAADVTTVPVKAEAECKDVLADETKTLQSVIQEDLRDLIASEEQLRHGTINVFGVALPLNDDQKAVIETNKAAAKARIVKALQTVKLKTVEK